MLRTIGKVRSQLIICKANTKGKLVTRTIPANRRRKIVGVEHKEND
ncbi:hypothetical protein [uncultured Nostoc sp.]